MTERYRVFVVVDRKYGERLAELPETVLRSVLWVQSGVLFAFNSR